MAKKNFTNKTENQFNNLINDELHDKNIWSTFPPSLISTRVWLPLDITLGLIYY